MKRIKSTRDVVLNNLNLIKGDVIDVGAGRAWAKPFIEQQLQVTSYTAFDAHPSPKIDVVGDVLNMPFVEEFNTAICNQVLEHVNNPYTLVKEIHRVLKKDGICILTAPFMVLYHPDPEDYFRYTTEGMRAIFTQSNFEVIECGRYGKLFSVISEMIHHTFFNPYKNKSIWKQRIVRYMEKLAWWLDGFNFTGDRIYANTYIIARKK